MALALAAPELRAQDTLFVNLSLRTTDFSFGTQDGYDVINPKLDRMGHIMIPGHPQLPTWHPAYIIPYWKDMAYCEIVALDSVQIPGTWNIYPAQKEVPIGDSADWTPPDPAIYNSDSLYPGKLMLEPGSGAFDGARIATLNLYPIRYRPKSGRLFLYTNATLKLVFKDSEPPINAKQRYAHVQEIYDRMMADLIENDADIGAWYRRPAIIDPNGGKDLLVPAYIIITTQAQEQYVQPYVTWMWQRGYVTGVYCVEDFLPDYPGYDDAEKMRNFIIDKYNDWGTSLFLFLGHERNLYQPNGIPFRYLCTSNDQSDEPETPPSDLYFSSMDGTWDGDDDKYYGEPEDYDLGSFDVYPEVFVGRVLAYTPNSPYPPGHNEVENWIAKVLNYEKNPGNAGYMKYVKYLVSFYNGDFLTLAQDNATHYPSFGWTISYIRGDVNEPSDMVDTLNQYRCGWVNTYGHGSPYGIVLGDGEYEFLFAIPRYGSPNLDDLTNQNRYFIVYSPSCYNAGFDEPGSFRNDTCLGEAWFETFPDKGGWLSWEIQETGILTSLLISTTSFWISFLITRAMAIFSVPLRHGRGLCGGFPVEDQLSS